MEKLVNLYRKYKEIVNYLIFGVLTTAVNWVTYILLVKLAGMGATDTKITIANAIAWVVAVTFAFITNKLWVFESRSFSANVFWKEAAAFFGARIFTGLFEMFLPTALMKLGMDQPLFGVEGFLAKIVTSVLVIILNYVLSKLLVFRRKDKAEKTEEPA